MRFATIGTSAITDKMVQAIRLTGQAKVEAVYSRNQRTGEAYARKHSVTKVYTQLQELVLDPTIDGVYVASPNALHYDQVIELLKGKKHVLCEKALGSNVRQVEEMMAVADQEQVVLMEALRSLYDPGFLEAKEALRKVGQLRKAQIQYCKYSSRYDDYKQGKESNIFKKELSAGALMDIGVYCTQMMMDLFGQPQQILATGVLLRDGIDGAGTILAKYPKMTAELSYSKISDSKDVSIFQGEEGSLYVTNIDSPTQIEFISRKGESELINLPVRVNNMQYEVEEFISMVKEYKTGYRNRFERAKRNSIETMKLLDEARKQIGIEFPADRN